MRAAQEHNQIGRVGMRDVAPHVTVGVGESRSRPQRPELLSLDGGQPRSREGERGTSRSVYQIGCMMLYFLTILGGRVNTDFPILWSLAEPALRLTTMVERAAVGCPDQETAAPVRQAGGHVDRWIVDKRIGAYYDPRVLDR